LRTRLAGIAVGLPEPAKEPGSASTVQARSASEWFFPCETDSLARFKVAQIQARSASEWFFPCETDSLARRACIFTIPTSASLFRQSLISHAFLNAASWLFSIASYDFFAFVDYFEFLSRPWNTNRQQSQHHQHDNQKVCEKVALRQQ